MTLRRSMFAAIALIAVMFAATGAILLKLPVGASVPFHFSIEGTPSGWVKPIPGLLIFPGIALLALILLHFAPRLSRRGLGGTRPGLYGTRVLVVIAFLALVQIYLLAATLQRTIAFGGFLSIALGTLFIVIGNSLGKLRPNYFIGVRLPWTLSDEHVWNQTNRYTGWVSVFCGITLLANGIALHGSVQTGVLGLALATVIVLPVLRAYSLSRKHRRQNA